MPTCHTNMMRAVLIVLALCATATAAPGRRVVTDTKITILEPIRFVGTSERIAATSIGMLDAVAETLKGNPSIRIMEIVAYGSDVPTDQIVLGTKRAKAVVEALVRRGVVRNRLRYSGEARADTRDQGPRFLILDRGP